MKLRPQSDHFNSLKKDLKFQTGQPLWSKTNSAKSMDCIHGLSGLIARCQTMSDFRGCMSNSFENDHNHSQIGPESSPKLSDHGWHGDVRPFSKHGASNAKMAIEQRHLSKSEPVPVPVRVEVYGDF